MSTRTEFDVMGLQRAVELPNPQYRLALYADTAELVIRDEDEPTSPPEILHGKAAIRGWIDSLCAGDVGHRVICSEISNGDVALIEECLKPDGSAVVYTCVAEVSRGRIVREVVGRRQMRPDAKTPSSDAVPTSPRSNPQPRQHERAATIQQSKNRLADYYLG